METKQELNYDFVRANCAIGLLPMLVERTMDELRQGGSLPRIDALGIQKYCADLAVTYTDALVERLKER